MTLSQTAKVEYICSNYYNKNYDVTIDLLGEHVSDIDEIKKVTGTYIELLKQINLLKLTSNISVKPTHIGLDRGINTFKNNAYKLVEEAKKYRIVLGIEPHIGSLISKPKLAEKLIKNVPGLTLTLDYGHFVREGYKDKAIEPLLKYASHFHVRGGCKGRLQTSFDSNTIDFKRVFNVLKNIDYRGWLTLEYVWIDWEHCNECDNLSETIRYRDFFLSLQKG